jgi:DNA ligase-associated metallophosphoesterase
VTATDVAGETLSLLPERAIYWPRTKTLIVADLHWGKEETFRAGGVPIPLGPVHADLRRLDRIIEETSAERLLILGDLWHARAGMTLSLIGDLEQWRATHASLAIELIRGNHDRRAGPLPNALHLTVREEPAIEAPFVFQHFPVPSVAGYVLAGHVHPAVVLRGPGKQKIRLPCFWFGREVGLLPAFGGFTGAAEIIPANGDRVFVATDTEVIEVSACRKL